MAEQNLNPGLSDSKHSGLNSILPDKDIFVDFTSNPSSLPFFLSSEAGKQW